MLTRYRELGGELITVGSDSHSPKTMGNGIEQAMNRLRELGFRNVYTFIIKNRLQYHCEV